jgi:hypothetical protein
VRTATTTQLWHFGTAALGRVAGLTRVPSPEHNYHEQSSGLTEIDLRFWRAGPLNYVTVQVTTFILSILIL